MQVAEELPQQLHLAEAAERRAQVVDPEALAEDPEAQRQAQVVDPEAQVRATKRPRLAQLEPVVDPEAQRQALAGDPEAQVRAEQQQQAPQAQVEDPEAQVRAAGQPRLAQLEPVVDPEQVVAPLKQLTLAEQAELALAELAEHRYSRDHRPLRLPWRSLLA